MNFAHRQPGSLPVRNRPTLQNPVLPVAAFTDSRPSERAALGPNRAIQASQRVFKPLKCLGRTFYPANFAAFGRGLVSRLSTLDLRPSAAMEVTHG
jgi:hypothetical protein